MTYSMQNDGNLRSAIWQDSASTNTSTIETYWVGLVKDIFIFV